VTGDSSLNGNLFVSAKTVNASDVSMNSKLFVGNDVSMGGRLFVTRDVSMNGKLAVGSNFSAPGVSPGITPKFNAIYGINSGNGLTSGANNTFIGYSTGNSQTSGSNTTAIGYAAETSTATASNEVTLGNSSISKLRCAVTTITSLSDARDKTNIEPIPAGLDFVDRLNPVKFTWNMRDGGKVGIDEFGFVAQELQSAQQSAGINYPNLVSSDNPERLEASYTTLVPALVKAIQELKVIVTEQRAEIEALKSKV
jgi:hypothetical protein